MRKYPFPLEIFRTFFRKHPALAIGGGSILLTISLVLGGKSADPVAQYARAYSDVSADATSADAITEMSRLGFLRGYENGLFGPDDPVTRGQVAILLKRLRDREIKALRAQVEELRAQLSLGVCGDALIQTGEECDDGNVLSQDGCSAECLQEVLREACPDGHRIDEEYQAADGCNTCICTRSGAICTKMQCSAPEEPLVEEPAVDGAEPFKAASNTAPICGNTICEQKENDLPPDQRFHCPQDCTGKPSEPQCADLTQEFHVLADTARACQSDADCVELQQSCPFLTCGEAVNKLSYPTLSLKRDALLEICRREGSIKECITCPYSAAICREGQCVLIEESR